jgi:hypothetical protein
MIINKNEGRISTRSEIIQRQTKGQIYDNSLDHLAGLCYNIGDYTKAEPLYENFYAPLCTNHECCDKIVNLRML